MWHKHERRKMLAEAEEKVSKVRTDVEETVEFQTVLCEVRNETEHQSVMREASSQPEEEFSIRHSFKRAR
jgi:hypothetical protein